MRDQIPRMASKGLYAHGEGVQIQRKEVPMSEPRDGRQPCCLQRVTGKRIMIQRDPEQRGPFATGQARPAPFPYYGGKSRWIDLVFQRIGKVGVWSGALLRHRGDDDEQPRARAARGDLRPQRLRVQLLPLASCADY